MSDDVATSHGHGAISAWKRAPRAWRDTFAAVFLSVVLAVATVALVSIAGDGVGFFALVMALAAGLFAVPAYMQGRRTDRLVALSHTDALTGIANRRALQLRLEQEIARCSRGERPLALMIADLDGLKQINDGAGHRAGDEALKIVARVLHQSTRISDVVGRLGGDEFVVIAPDTGRDTAHALAERIAEDLRSIPMDDGTSWHPELSIGVATVTPTSADLDALMRAADAAMYAAKRGGGGCVVSAPEPPADVIPLRPAART